MPGEVVPEEIDARFAIAGRPQLNDDSAAALLAIAPRQNIPKEKIVVRPRAHATSAQRLRFIADGILRGVVGRFLCDCNVMRMILPHTSRRHLDESRVRAQLLDSFCATITHTGP